MIAVKGNATDAKLSEPNIEHQSSMLVGDTKAEPNVEHQSSMLVGDTKSLQAQVLWSWGWWEWWWWGEEVGT